MEIEYLTDTFEEQHAMPEYFGVVLPRVFKILGYLLRSSRIRKDSAVARLVTNYNY